MTAVASDAMPSAAELNELGRRLGRVLMATLIVQLGPERAERVAVSIIGQPDRSCHRLARRLKLLTPEGAS